MVKQPESSATRKKGPGRPRKEDDRLSPEERKKKDRRREKNKKAAAKYRQKKKADRRLAEQLKGYNIREEKRIFIAPNSIFKKETKGPEIIRDGNFVDVTVREWQSSFEAPSMQQFHAMDTEFENAKKPRQDCQKNAIFLEGETAGRVLKVAARMNTVYNSVLSILTFAAFENSKIPHILGAENPPGIQ